MKKAIIVISYSEEYMEQNQTSLEEELKWLKDSEITVEEIKMEGE